MQELDERKQKILHAIIQNYLETGEPVGSRTISKYSDLKLSSATIRNEMSDLEELGYIVCNKVLSDETTDCFSGNPARQRSFQIAYWSLREISKIKINNSSKHYWLMDAFNENSNEQQVQQPMGCLHRFSKTIKVVIIGLLILLLMIPMFMIENLISERGRTQEEAIDEVSEKWSLAQTITGPTWISSIRSHWNNGEKKVSIKDLILFPDELMVSGQLKTEILKRSIYEVNVYQSELTLKGSFSSEELKKSRIDMDQLSLTGRLFAWT